MLRYYYGFKLDTGGAEQGGWLNCGIDFTSVLPIYVKRMNELLIKQTGSK